VSLSIWDDEDLVCALGYSGRDHDVMIAESAWAARRVRRAEAKPPRPEPTAEELRAQWRAWKRRVRQRAEVRERERAYDIRRRRAEGRVPWPEYVRTVRERAARSRPQLFFPWLVDVPSIRRSA